MHAIHAEPLCHLVDLTSDAPATRITDGRPTKLQVTNLFMWNGTFSDSAAYAGPFQPPKRGRAKYVHMCTPTPLHRSYLSGLASSRLGGASLVAQSLDQEHWVHDVFLGRIRGGPIRCTGVLNILACKLGSSLDRLFFTFTIEVVGFCNYLTVCHTLSLSHSHVSCSSFPHRPPLSTKDGS